MRGPGYGLLRRCSKQTYAMEAGWPDMFEVMS